jgi:hypothetical protein
MPIATLWAEAGFIEEHINNVLATHAVLVHTAIVDAIAGGGIFKKAIEELTDG